MAVTVYRSTDGSAPVLDGQAGSLVALLKAVLVNGYGAKPAAGWSNPFNGTNAGVLRMGAGNQFYLDVNDNGASNGLTGASGQEAATRGYEVMTAASTGTGPFPTTAQVAANTSNWRKSATADATARGWFVVADDRSFMLGVLDGDSAGRYKLYTFGDFYSLKSGDAYRVGITVRTVVNSTAATGTFGTGVLGTSGSGGTAAAGMYLARISPGTGTSISPVLTSVGSSWETALAFSQALDGNVFLARILVNESTFGPALRGWLRGVWQILNPIGIADGDTWSGTGDLTGRSFVAVKNFGGVSAQGLAFETTAWDTSS